jgi:hypothetical protein
MAAADDASALGREPNGFDFGVDRTSAAVPDVESLLPNGFAVLALGEITEAAALSAGTAEASGAGKGAGEPALGSVAIEGLRPNKLAADALAGVDTAGLLLLTTVTLDSVATTGTLEVARLANGLGLDIGFLSKSNTNTQTETSTITDRLHLHGLRAYSSSARLLLSWDDDLSTNWMRVRDESMKR